MNPGERRHELKNFLKGCHIIKGSEKKKIHDEVNSMNKTDNMQKIKKKDVFLSCSRKWRFKTQSEATYRANFHTKSGHGNFRAYHCDICGGWHITSHRMKEKYLTLGE